MNKGKFIPDPVLMIITLIVVTGFQLYWLHNNYEDAQRNLEIQTNATFQETVRGLHIKTLRLDTFRPDHPGDKITQLSKHPDPDNLRPGLHEEQIITTVNALRSKMPNSVQLKNVIIERDSIYHDSPKAKLAFKGFYKILDSAKTVQIVLDLDSLHDSLELPKLVKAYSLALKEQKIDIPFSIAQLQKASPEDTVMSEVTVGLSHPATYKLQLGNTFPFLMKKISLPILFSVFLVGITIISFLVLYKNLLRQRRLAVIKNEFIGNITHELKTPIATVGVAIEALKNFNAMHDPQKTREYLDISANELQRLSLLVDKVLKLSMFEKKQVQLNKETLDMRELLNEVLNIMKLQFERHHAAVSVKMEGDNFMMEADRLHITSVLYNLLDNALKYSGDNSAIEINLSALPHDIIELKIKDNGTGIPKEYQQKIFEKFFRVPMGDKHNIKGYGLGLSYVSEIVRQHMGFITVESVPGNGATFTIKIPRKEANVIYFDDKRKIIRKSHR